MVSHLFLWLGPKRVNNAAAKMPYMKAIGYRPYGLTDEDLLTETMVVELGEAGEKHPSTADFGDHSKHLEVIKELEEKQEDTKDDDPEAQHWSSRRKLNRIFF